MHFFSFKTKLEIQLLTLLYRSESSYR